jgi:hypothetical protein
MGSAPGASLVKQICKGFCVVIMGWWHGCITHFHILTIATKLKDSDNTRDWWEAGLDTSMLNMGSVIICEVSGLLFCSLVKRSGSRIAEIIQLSL